MVLGDVGEYGGRVGEVGWRDWGRGGGGREGPDSAVLCVAGGNAIAIYLCSHFC